MSRARMRRAGMLVPVWCLRRDGALGIGDTAALRELVDWAADIGLGFVQVLPVNEAGKQPCPYLAISSVALEPALLAMDEIAWVGPEDLERARREASPKVLTGNFVDYREVRSLKRRLLERAFDRFWRDDRDGPPGEAFALFREEEAGWLDRYCKFRWLMDLEGGSEEWDLWSINYNTPEKAGEWIEARRRDRPSEAERALAYHAWVQWIAFTQWRELAEHARGRDVKLMGDIPIGISFASADVFFERQWFDLAWSGGAPPERVFKDDEFAVQWGQNWGLPLYRWDLMEADGFSWWRRRLEKFCGVFDACRIDHILGFYRIYAFPWQPRRNREFLGLSHSEAAARTGGRMPGFLPFPDDSADHCEANLQRGDRSLRAILDAAGPCELVGEDLGAVPGYVRPHLAELGVAGFKICHWEVETDRAGIEHPIPGSKYDECSFATYATHDHPPVAAMWEDFRSNLDSQDHGERIGAHWNLRILSEFAGLPVPTDGGAFAPYDAHTKWALLEALLATSSRYAAFMITDLFGMSERFNTPATVSSRNWSLRMPFTVEEMRTRPDLRAEAHKLRKAIRKADR